MAELISSNSLTTFSFTLVIINAFASIWKTLDRKVLLFVNVLLYVVIFICSLEQDNLLWFGQQYFQNYGPYLACFSVISSITGLFFLEIKGKEKIDGPLLASVFLVLSLSLLFSSDILRISLLLVLFEILELLVLSNTEDIKRSMLKDLALTKLFSIAVLLIGTTFIIVSKDSVSVLESNVKNYDLYYLGVCFFIIYILGVMYISPLEEIKRRSLFNSSNFSVVCSILSKFVVLGTVLISILKIFILDMEPHAQEEILFGLDIVILFSIITLTLRAMSKKNKGKIIYYLFCMNNVLALFAVYGIGVFNMGLIFFLLALSSLGLFVGVYIERKGHLFMGAKSRWLVFMFYFLGVITLWGIPTTRIFKIRYLLMEHMFSFETTLLLIIFMLISALLWYPTLTFLNERLKKISGNKEDRAIGMLEYVGLFLVLAQILILNYSKFLVGFSHE